MLANEGLVSVGREKNNKVGVGFGYGDFCAERAGRVAFFARMGT